MHGMLLINEEYTNKQVLSALFSMWAGSQGFKLAANIKGTNIISLHQVVEAFLPIMFSCSYLFQDLFPAMGQSAKNEMHIPYFQRYMTFAEDIIYGLFDDRKGYHSW